MGHKKITFGSYAMVHIGTTNTIKRRCVPATTLKALNDYDGYFLMNIFTTKQMFI